MFKITDDIIIWYDINVNSDTTFELINKYKVSPVVVEKIKNQGFLWCLMLSNRSHLTITNTLLDLIPISSNFMLDFKDETKQSIKFTSNSISSYNPVQKRYEFDGDIITFLNKRGTPC